MDVNFKPTNETPRIKHRSNSAEEKAFGLHDEKNEINHKMTTYYKQRRKKKSISILRSDSLISLIAQGVE